MGNGLYFNGSAVVESGISGIPLGANARTIEIRFKIAEGNAGVLFDYGVNEAGKQFSFYTSEAWSGFGGYAQDLAMSPVTAIAAGSEVLYTVTYDGTTLSQYLNGDPNNSAEKILNTTSSTFAIGGMPGGQTSPWDRLEGKIYEFRAWTVCRSAEDVKKYANYKLRGNEANLSRYYDFHEGEGETLTDLVNGINGTIIGATWVTDGIDLRYLSSSHQCMAGGL